MKHTAHRSRAVLAVLIAVLAGAAGCGVQPTGVIPAGPAPAGFETGRRDSQLTLYFRFDGRLSPVERHQAAAVSPEAAVKELFRGPTAAESAKGYTSMLPYGTGTPSVDTTSNPVTVTVPYPLKALYPGGLDQVVCTTMAALSASGQANAVYGVSVKTSDARLDNVRCGTF
ncbi:hypothetical protein GCM10022222_57750 [Amycolatopsis ultiminotia]|uniref:Lipoprotein n=1 Tax=Amycolatopsis ultiminotia TaxID=543629 RepID=A0ABP6XFD0_9PSEU